MVGLVLAGPWLTMVGARLMVRRARRPAGLIAARRLADDPKAGFRAVSGLVLALYVTSAALGVITTIVAERGRHTGNALVDSTVWQFFWPDGRAMPPASGAAAVPGRLRAIPGVHSATLVDVNPERTGSGLVACADLARASEFGRCAPGAQVAAVDPGLILWRASAEAAAANVWPTAGVSLDRLRAQPVVSIVVGTNGGQPVIERVRTVLELAYSFTYPPHTEHENETDATTALAGWQQLADVVILTSLPIAGCSLAVAVAGGLTERRRPFSLLRPETARND